MNVTSGLEEVPEAWQDFILDVAQRSAHKIGRSDHESPWSGDWLIKAYREGYLGTELVLAVRIGKGEPAYLSAVLVRTAVERGQLGITPPADGGGLDADGRDEQFVMLVADIELVKNGQVVVRWRRLPVRLYLIEDPPHFLRNSGADVEMDPAWRQREPRHPW